MKPLVTVLMTTYNSERWVKKAIASIINQTYNNLQILIIDDGSTDQTVSVIKSTYDPRIELYIKEHSGISKSLNFAANKIKGKYYSRLGADDYCEVHRIEKLLLIAKENVRLGVTGSNFILVDEFENEIERIRYPEKHEHIADLLPRKSCLWDGSALIKTELIHHLNGYDENRIIGEDWDFFLRCIGKTEFYNIQEYLTFKRLHTSNISLISSAKKETEEILLNYNYNIIENSNNKSGISKAYFNIGYHYYYSDRFNEASEKFKDALDIYKSSLSFWRYYLASKYLSPLIKFVRKKKLFRFYNWLRHLDKGNVFIRGRF